MYKEERDYKTLSEISQTKSINMKIHLKTFEDNGRQLVSFRFENCLPQLEHRNSPQQKYIWRISNDIEQLLQINFGTAVYLSTITELIGEMIYNGTARKIALWMKTLSSMEEYTVTCMITVTSVIITISVYYFLPYWLIIRRVDHFVTHTYQIWVLNGGECLRWLGFLVISYYWQELLAVY